MRLQKSVQLQQTHVSGITSLRDLEAMDIDLAKRAKFLFSFLALFKQEECVLKILLQILIAIVLARKILALSLSHVGQLGPMLPEFLFKCNPLQLYLDVYKMLTILPCRWVRRGFRQPTKRFFWSTGTVAKIVALQSMKPVYFLLT